MGSSEKGGGRVSLLAATAVAAVVAALGLAACGSSGGIEGGGSQEVETVKLEGKPSGSLTISNWPLYIDKETVPDFEKETGIKVKYIEDINSNEEFFSKMQPLLQEGESGGRSIFVLADYETSKMYKLGYLQNLDKSALPNVERNLLQSLRHPPIRPEPRLHGALAERDDRDHRQQRTGAGDQIDLRPVRLEVQGQGRLPQRSQGNGAAGDEVRRDRPGKATEADWMKAIEKIKGAAESGQIRRFTGNDYARDLTSGDVVAVIGWSGDAVQLQADNPNLEWRMPTEGCMLWSEDMVIPIGAPNPTAAEAFMNYVYDPKTRPSSPNT